MRRSVLLLIVLIIVSTVGTTAWLAASAQQEASSVESTGITDVNVQVSVNQVTQIDARYRFKVPDGKDQRTRRLNGTMWAYGDSPTRNLSVTVDGRAVNSTVTPNSRHTLVSVPVKQSGDITTVRFQYTVETTSKRVHVPLWVPTITVDTESEKLIRVTFPRDAQQNSLIFPTPDQEFEAGRIAEARLRQVPGFLVVESESTTPDQSATTGFVDGLLGDLEAAVSGLSTALLGTRIGLQLLLFTLVAVGYLAVSSVLMYLMGSERGIATDITDGTEELKEGER